MVDIYLIALQGIGVCLDTSIVLELGPQYPRLRLMFAAMPKTPMIGVVPLVIPAAI